MEKDAVLEELYELFNLISKKLEKNFEKGGQNDCAVRQFCDIIELAISESYMFVLKTIAR